MQNHVCACLHRSKCDCVLRSSCTFSRSMLFYYWHMFFARFSLAGSCWIDIEDPKYTSLSESKPLNISQFIPDRNGMKCVPRQDLPKRRLFVFAGLPASCAVVKLTEDLDILANRYRVTSFAGHDKAAGSDALRFYEAWLQESKAPGIRVCFFFCLLEHVWTCICFWHFLTL